MERQKPIEVAPGTENLTAPGAESSVTSQVIK